MPDALCTLGVSALLPEILSAAPDDDRLIARHPAVRVLRFLELRAWHNATQAPGATPVVGTFGGNEARPPAARSTKKEQAGRPRSRARL